MFKIILIFPFLISCEFISKKYRNYYPSLEKKLIYHAKIKKWEKVERLITESYLKEPLSLISYFNWAYANFKKIEQLSRSSKEVKNYKLTSDIYLYILELIKNEESASLIRFLSFFNLAVLYQEKKELKTALYYYQKALSVKTKEVLKKHKQVKINIELLLKKDKSKKSNDDKSKKSNDNKSEKNNDDKTSKNQNGKEKRDSIENQKKELKNKKTDTFKNKENKENKEKKGNSSKKEDLKNKKDKLSNKSTIRSRKEFKSSTDKVLTNKNIEQILKSIRLKEEHVYEQIQNKNKKTRGLNDKDW